jgi:hypothetical protein
LGGVPWNVYVTAVTKGAAIAQPPLRGQSSYAVHRPGRLVPTALVNVASGTAIVIGIVDMATSREAVDLPGQVAGLDKIGNEALESRGKPGCYSNPDPGRRLYRDQSDPVADLHRRRERWPPRLRRPHWLIAAR